jgi:cobyrinic acid a,c-diamide synthase
MTLIIAGDRSGVGKTTVTLAILSFLAKKKLKVQSFKVGPDYIDPMFHTAITDRPCRNLDPVLTSEAYVSSCFARHTQQVDYALVEGVMGLFDGISLQEGWKESTFSSSNLKNFASTAHIAKLLNLPILLVLDCSHLSGSIAAIAHGYNSFDRDINIAGIVLNRVGSDRHLQLLKDALEPLQIPILGALYRQQEIKLHDRHLGLVPTAEIEHLKDLFERLATLAETCFDWQKLLPLIRVENRPRSIPSAPVPITKTPMKIAIAGDRAFNFYYQDNLDLLTELGAELIYWSPLEDEHLPDSINGLYFGGGFPEIFSKQLSENKRILTEVRLAVRSQLPTYAECGGLMYLCEEIIDFDGNSRKMVGILPTKASMSQHLTLGYRQATSLLDTFLLKKNETVFGHEFHRSQLTIQPTQPLFTNVDRNFQNLASEGWYFLNLHASYLHLHFGDFQQIPKNFLNCCRHQIHTLHYNKLSEN